jgi:ankyrin repeat protein
MKLRNFITYTRFIVFMALCNINIFNISCMDQAELDQLLYSAADRNEAKEVKKLLAQHANPNTIDPSYHYTPLHSAAAEGNVEIIQMLLEAGANSDEKTIRFGDTSLHFAIYRGELSAVKALLEADANVNATNNNGVTPMMAAAVNDRIDIGQALLEYGAHLEGTSKQWQQKLIPVKTD